MLPVTRPHSDQETQVHRQLNCKGTEQGFECNQNHEKENSLDRKWSCGQDRRGRWMKYYGRGAIQLKYIVKIWRVFKGNVLQRSSSIRLFRFWSRHLVELSSVTWFYVTPQTFKPSLISGALVTNVTKGLTAGFGTTINIISGGEECGTSDGVETRQAHQRISYFKQFAWYLYADYNEEYIGCGGQGNFWERGAAAVPLFWDKDIFLEYSCKLVMYIVHCTRQLIVQWLRGST